MKILSKDNGGGKRLNDESILLHPSIRLSIIIAQIFGFFPVYGVTNQDYKSLHFKWVSLKVGYSLTLLCVGSFIVCCEIHKMLSEMNMHEMTGLIFYSCETMACFLLIKLAQDWPGIIKKWSQVESSMHTYGIKTNLKLKLRFITIGFLSVAAVEHFMVQIFRIITTVECTTSFSAGLKHFFCNVSCPHIFRIVEYAPWKGLIFQYSIVQLTFSWTFIDVLIILISTAFSMRMRQLTAKVEILLKSKIDALIVWKTIREEHYQLYELCRYVDEKFSYLILLSYFTNLYFILIQLFSTFKNVKDSIEKTYFFISFFFLISRLICVCIFGATINDERKQLLPTLLTCPSEIYNFEVQRFIDQVNQINISLTGRRFFKITKGLILNIAGAIVTYELVLIQFNGGNFYSDESENMPVQQNPPDYWICNK